MKNSENFPLYSPGKETLLENENLLVADVRKRRTFFAIYEVKEGALSRSSEREYATRDFSSFAEMTQRFIAETGAKTARMSVAVPGPVIHGRCETTNLPWEIDAAELQENLGIKTYLINDMEATAYSLADLSQAEVITIHNSENLMPGNVAILAAGNGLGEAGLFWDGKSLHPFATEGGHTEFSPRNEFEVEFYKFLQKIYGIVSWENVLSKDGLYNIYRYMRDIGRHKESADLTSKIQENDFLSGLVEAGKSSDSRLAKLTLEMFAEFLAREANYLVLKLKATGGLIITGEIAEQVRAFIDKDKFYKDFMISDKMENLLKDIPIYFVFNQKAISQGAAYYGAYRAK